MKMEMQLQVKQIQTLKLAPPIAVTEEQAKANAVLRQTRELSDNVIEAVREFIETQEKPYNNQQILAYVHGLGYEKVNKADIAYARRLLKTDL